MTENRRIFLIVGIMAAISACAVAITLIVLYHAAFEEQRARLEETVRSQARLIEAIAEHELKYEKSDFVGSNHGSPLEATLHQLKNAHKHFSGFGNTGEYTLARKKDDQIQFLLRHRHEGPGNSPSVPFDSDLAEPMRRALSGKSGTLVGRDYRGVTVLAAYEPVAVFDLGIVAKIDLAEIRSPFLRAGLLALFVLFALILAGAFLILRMGNPFIRRLKEYARDLEKQVAEREQMEKEAVGARRNWEEIFQAIGHPAMVMDANHRVMEANRATILATGRSKEELLGKKCFEIFHNLSEPPAGCPMENLITTGRTSTIEMEVEALVGTFLVSCTPVVDDQGRLEKVIHIATEISDRKKMENALQESEERFRRLAENAPDMIYRMVLPDGRYEYASPASERIFGYSPEELYASPQLVRQVIHPDWLEYFQLEWDKLLKGEMPPYYEYQIIHKSGEVRWVHQRNVLIRDPEGRPAAIEGIVTDVTVRKEAEDGIRMEKERAQQYLDLAGVMMVAMDKTGAVTMINPAGCEILGYTEQEILGKNWFDHFLPESARGAVREGFDDLMAGRIEPMEFYENVVLTRQGQERLIAWHNAILTNADGAITGSLSSGEDVTERRRVEEERKRLTGIVEKTTDFVSTSSPDGKIIYINSAGRRMLGIDEEEIVSDCLIGEFHPSWAYDLIRQEGLPYAIEHGSWSGETALLHRDGTEIHVSQVIIAQRSQNGELIALSTIIRDITELKQSEEALRASEATLKSIFRASPVGIGLVRNRILQWVNYQIIQMTGYSSSELIGNSARILYQTDEDFEYVGKEKYRQIAEFGTGTVETQWKTRDGRILDVLLSSTPLDQKDLDAGVTFTALDITDRKRAEERFRMAAQTTSDLIYEWDVATDELLWFGPLDRALGYGPGEIERSFEGWSRLIHPMDAPRMRESAGLRRTAGRPIRESYRVLCRNGGFRHWEDYSVPVLDRENRPIRWIGACLDVTERKEAENQLKESEEKFSKAFRASPYAVGISSLKEGRYLDVNDGFCKMLEYAKEEVVGKTSDEIHLFVDYDQRRKAAEILMTNGRFSDFELQLRTKSGRILDCLFSAEMIEIQGEPCLIAIANDISERKRNERERTELEAQLRHQQKLESIGTLASGVAHEINNPLNGMMNYAQLIANRLDPDHPLQLFAREILIESERVSEIVRNLLAFSRQEKQSHSPARLKDVVESALSLIRTVIKKDQIELDIEIPDDLPKIKCRSQQIQQVVMNLMTNARDALNERYPGYDENKKIIIRIDNIDKEGEPFLRTLIEDHGNGIDPELIDRIFDPFFTTKPRDQGTGLGLAVSYGIVKDHHGQLLLESIPGVGTRFYLDLPINNGWEV